MSTVGESYDNANAQLNLLFNVEESLESISLNTENICHSIETLSKYMNEVSDSFDKLQTAIADNTQQDHEAALVQSLKNTINTGSTETLVQNLSQEVMGPARLLLETVGKLKQSVVGSHSYDDRMGASSVSPSPSHPSSSPSPSPSSFPSASSPSAIAASGKETDSGVSRSSLSLSDNPLHPSSSAASPSLTSSSPSLSSSSTALNSSTSTSRSHFLTHIHGIKIGCQQLTHKGSVAIAHHTASFFAETQSRLNDMEHQHSEEKQQSKNNSSSSSSLLSSSSPSSGTRSYRSPLDFQGLVDSIEWLLDYPDARTFFRRFLVEKDRSSENIDFYTAVITREREPAPKTRALMARSIFDKFISESSPQTLNLQRKQREEIEKVIQEIPQDENDVPHDVKGASSSPWLFSKLKNEIVQTLRKDALPRFRQSSQRTQLIAELESRAVVAGEESNLSWAQRAEQFGNLMVLNRKDMYQWTVKEVYSWVRAQQLEEVAEVLKNADVSGEVLVSLSSDDLTSLGVSKIGHAKRLHRMVSKLRQRQTLSRRKTSLQRAESITPSNTMTVKVCYEQDIRMLELPSNCGLDKLRKMLENEFQCPMKVFANMGEAMVPVQSDMVLAIALTNTPSDGAVRLYVSPDSMENSIASTTTNGNNGEGSSALTKGRHGSQPIDEVLGDNQSAILMTTLYFTDNLSDAVIGFAPEEETCVFSNAYAETILGDIMGDAFTSILPGTSMDHLVDAEEPQQLSAVGEGGHSIPVSARATTEATGEQAQNRLCFVVMQPLESNPDDEGEEEPEDSLQKQRSKIANRSDPSIIVDNRGVIQDINHSAEEALGYNLIECLGKSVKICLPFVDLNNLEGAMEDGVVVQARDGSLRPSNLSMVEFTDSNRDFRTLIFGMN